MVFFHDQFSTCSFDASIDNCSTPLGVFSFEEDFLNFQPTDICTQARTSKQSQKVSQSDFHLVKVIGKGSFGKVYLVRKLSGQDSGTYYAMKVIKKKDVCVRLKDKELTTNERFILERLNYPFLVRLFYAFQTEEKLFLILEYVPGGELFSHLLRERMLLQSEAKFHLAQIALAIHHLHQCGIIYRDLKPENILRDAEGFIKITDFGMSKVYLKESTSSSDERESIDYEYSNCNCEQPVTTKASTFCGTMEFMAPEILLEQEYDQMVDWWSFGILIFYTLTGLVPFKANNRQTLIEKIRDNRISFPKYITPEAKELIRKCLRKNPKDRFSFYQISQNSFFNGIDWALMEARQMSPPNKPVLNQSNPEDVSNFDSEFTGMALESLPSETTLNVCKEDLNFYGFTFVSKSILIFEED